MEKNEIQKRFAKACEIKKKMNIIKIKIEFTSIISEKIQKHEKEIALTNEVAPLKMENVIYDFLRKHETELDKIISIEIERVW